ncbi:MAG: tRNA 4-thiouridine(8) synthase ThiI [Deltaproteobacteria bacterium]|nr:tRNA 4-thiouridine(8) synthase ThiI [Deltaproteobacteria bacterium]
MAPFPKRVSALGLFSGGLDSILAAKVLIDQGVEVTGVAFISTFFGADQATKAADEMGISLIVKDLSQSLLAIVQNPRHGYGANMNPCIDCHALMIKEAGKIMKAHGFDFIFTGEVLNERPMSQTKRSLTVVAKLSGWQDFLLRPLSAKLLPETTFEKAGLVNRENLLDMEGRSRKRQLALIKQYGLKEYASPAGGCLLTDPNFSQRLRELFFYEKNPSSKDLELLKIGRHFRVQEKKVVIGRNERENDLLKKLADRNDVLLSAEHVPGPIALACNSAGKEDIITKAATLCVRYSDAKHDTEPPEIYRMGASPQIIIPHQLCEEEIRSLMI